MSEESSGGVDRDSGTSEQQCDSGDPATPPDSDLAATVRNLCRDSRCRRTLALLAYQGRPLTVNDLAKAVVGQEHSAPITSVPDRAVAEVYQSLERTHLPNLDAAGLVAYDPDRGLVEPTAELDRARPHVRELVEADPELDAPVEL